PVQVCFPGGVGCLLARLLSSCPGRVGQCRERTEMVCRAPLVPSAQNKRSTGGWYDNGEHLDRGREKAGSRTDRGLAQALHAPSREKQGWFPIAGNTTGAPIP